jgi:hypothetical protein
MLTVTDPSGYSASCQAEVTVEDSIAPEALALLDPLPADGPGSPASPAAPVSACSPSSIGQFQVVCGGSDECDPEPDLEAVLVVTNHEVDPVTHECIEIVDELEVECGELIEIELLPPVCPLVPASPQAPVSADSEGATVIRGEQVLLEVTATDDCGNQDTASADPTEPPPECENPLPDGSCCPPIAPPPAPDCPVPLCGS